MSPLCRVYVVSTGLSQAIIKPNFRMIPEASFTYLYPFPADHSLSRNILSPINAIKKALQMKCFSIYIFLVLWIKTISASVIAAKASTIGTALGTTQGS